MAGRAEVYSQSDAHNQTSTSFLPISPSAADQPPERNTAASFWNQATVCPA